MFSQLKNRKFLLSPLLLLIAVIVVPTAIYLTRSPSRDLKKSLNLGNKYLLEEEYHDAIAAFSKAIRIDANCVDAYLGLVTAYIGEHDMKSAINVARQGYTLTGDKRLLFADIESLINCPSICGISWNEAGGIDGMKSLFPPCDANGWFDNINFSIEDYSLDNDYNRILWVTDFDDNNFIYLENADKKKHKISVTFNIHTQPPSYIDGFYKYLLNYNLSLDNTVQAIGLDTDALKEGQILVYNTNLGPMVVDHFTASHYDENSFMIGYHFIKRENGDLGIWLSETHYEKDNENLVIVQLDIDPELSDADTQTYRDYVDDSFM